jgi:hypothetical protein
MEVVVRYDSGEDYSKYGYMLVRIPNKTQKNLYAFKNILHCCCSSTEYPEEDDFTLSYEDVIRFAENKSEPRVPDKETENEFLLKLYELILKNMKDNPEWIADKIYSKLEHRIIVGKVFLVDTDGNKEEVTEKMDKTKIEKLCQWISLNYNIRKFRGISLTRVIFDKKDSFKFIFVVNTEIKNPDEIPFRDIQKYFETSNKDFNIPNGISRSLNAFSVGEACDFKPYSYKVRVEF